jgi:hypothetical protein
VGALALDQSIQQEWAPLGLEFLLVEIGFVFLTDFNTLV